MKFVLTVIASILLYGCSKKAALEKFAHERIGYNELPDTVKRIYIHEVTYIDTFREIFVCIGCQNQSKFSKHTMDKSIWNLLKHGFIYEFSIKGRVYTLQANKGDPFVFYEDNLYYVEEFNLNKLNYKYCDYIKVRLGRR
jgi:hypothetical protein